MIELILQASAQHASVLRTMARERQGIEVVSIGLPDLYRRVDVDALVLGDHLAVEYFLAQRPRSLGWVVVDIATDMRVLIYEATITQANLPGARLPVAAAWIIVIPLFAPPCLAGDGDPAAVQIAEQGRTSISFEEAEYPLFLNALEVMERHNVAGKRPMIHRAAIMVDPVRMPSVLRAYDTYRERASNGAYQR
jgi:hypothetical protein